MASVERRVDMDVFCRCAGCHGCSGVRNPLGGTCDKAPQRYKIKGKSGKPDREGFRAYCKPCLRKQEQARAARSSATELGFVPAGSPSARASGHDHVPGNRPRIVLFGDSITEQSFGEGGFGAALANRYRRHADVLLRGYSGYNSRDAVALRDPRHGGRAQPRDRRLSGVRAARCAKHCRGAVSRCVVAAIRNV